MIWFGSITERVTAMAKKSENYDESKQAKDIVFAEGRGTKRELLRVMIRHFRSPSSSSTFAAGIATHKVSYAQVKVFPSVRRTSGACGRPCAPPSA